MHYKRKMIPFLLILIFFSLPRRLPFGISQKSTHKSHKIRQFSPQIVCYYEVNASKQNICKIPICFLVSTAYPHVRKPFQTKIQTWMPTPVVHKSIWSCGASAAMPQCTGSVPSIQLACSYGSFIHFSICCIHNIDRVRVVRYSDRSVSHRLERTQPLYTSDVFLFWSQCFHMVLPCSNSIDKRSVCRQRLHRADCIRNVHICNDRRTKMCCRLLSK